MFKKKTISRKGKSGSITLHIIVQSKVRTTAINGKYNSRPPSPHIDEGLLGHILVNAGYSRPGVGGYVAPVANPLPPANAGGEPLLGVVLGGEIHGVGPAAQRQLGSLEVHLDVPVLVPEPGQRGQMDVLHPSFLKVELILQHRYRVSRGLRSHEVFFVHFEYLPADNTGSNETLNRLQDTYGENSI
jgi:hypothetical protein